jgi:CBS domain-containing protein
MTSAVHNDPAVTRARDFETLRVSDAMHSPACRCAPEASLASVAHTMATRHIHAVIVDPLGEEADRPWGIVSALDVVGAAAHPDRSPSAADAAATEDLTIAADEPLRRAAQLMHEHELTHLVVVEGPDGRPVGVVSTLDVARAYANPHWPVRG